MSEEEQEQQKTFRDFGLDERLLRAIDKLGWTTPTLIQEKGISLGLAGKDVIARARTGSGKTATYSIPVIANCLNFKAQNKGQNVKAVILVPTKELCDQTLRHLQELTNYCSGDVTSIGLSSSAPINAQKPGLLEKPDIIVATPSRLLAHYKAKNVHFKHLSMVVMDEADLLFSFGYEEDVRSLSAFFPSTVQTFLMSATMTKDVEKLQNLLMRNPVVLKLKESHLPHDTHLQQHIVRCTENDKYLLLYALIAFKIVSGKVILFVNDINSCYKLKLFFDAFSIKSCILNSELPYNSRYHIVQEFNRGVYDIIIASDESTLLEDETDDEESDDDEDGVDDDIVVAESEDAKPKEPKIKAIASKKAKGPEVEIEYTTSVASESTDDTKHAIGEIKDEDKNNNNEAVDNANDSDSDSDDDVADEIIAKPKTAKELALDKKEKKTQLQRQKDGEYAMSRGVDFRDVEWVINVDFPTHANAYIHRVGRTARAGKHGNALSFMSNLSQQVILRSIEKKIGSEGGGVLKPYKFPLSKVEGLRYRVEDIKTQLTRGRIKAARLKDIRTEMLTSKKLKAHFEENPRELRVLKHNQPLDQTTVSYELKSIPSYLRPHKDDIAKERTALDNEHAPQKSYNFWDTLNKRKSNNSKGYKRKKPKTSDPLKSFSVARKKK